ncbi:MAG: hypothetical protein H0U00_15130 [Actinobacteria bacterium]|nr:hypothetical protein [Actinomycetota bacterium]
MTLGLHPDAVAAAREHTDRRKAAAWACLAGLGQGAIVLFGHLAFPYVRNLLLGPAYLLLLPAIAHLQLRHAGVRGSGATLGTITGVAALLLGVGGELNVDAQPAALFALGMWWWTIGKLWAETGVLSAAFGGLTAGAGTLALLASFVASGLAPLTALNPGIPDLALWDASRCALAAWSVILGLALYRSPGRLPSGRPEAQRANESEEHISLTR